MSYMYYINFAFLITIILTKYMHLNNRNTTYSIVIDVYQNLPKNFQ